MENTIRGTTRGRKRNKYKQITNIRYERTQNEYIQIEQKENKFIINQYQYNRCWFKHTLPYTFNSIQEAQDYIKNNYQVEVL